MKTDTSRRDAIRTDVAVVGGGPGGLVSALMLLRSGLSVTVLEKSPTLDRTFRGEVLQPGGIEVLDQLGVLGEAAALGSVRHHRFRFLHGEKTVFTVDYSRMPAPGDQLLSLPQRHLLSVLLQQCARHDRFRYLARQRVNDLVHPGRPGEQTSVITRDYAVHAQCVVGADGRHSIVRKLSGLGANPRRDSEFDVAWLRLAAAPAPSEVRTFADASMPVLSYHPAPDSVQIGCLIPGGSYPQLVDEGIARFRERLAQVAPPLAEPVREQLHDFDQVSLLDAFCQTAPRWSCPGVVLIGDAAHTPSPVGAQGINLSLQDAVALHPLLVRAIAQGNEQGSIAEFEAIRRPAVEQISAMQRAQTRMLFSPSRGPIARRARMTAVRLVHRTPLGAKITRRIAHGGTGAPPVRTDLFQTS